MPVELPKSLILLKSGHQLFAVADDNVIIQRVLATHSPNGREFSVRPLLDLVQDIFLRASFTIPIQTQETPESLEDEDHLFEIHMNIAESNIITRICYEYACCGVTDIHEETMALLSLLKSYEWDGKVALVLAAFAITYGDLAVLLVYRNTNPLAAAISILKLMPQMLVKNMELLKQKFWVINELIKDLITVANCIVEFKFLSSLYITSETPEMKRARKLIPPAVYWTIRIIVVCARQITSLTGMGHSYSVATIEAWELSSLAYKVDNIRQQLQQSCQHIDEKRQHQTFQNLVRLFQMPQINNYKILRALISSKYNQLSLIDCSTKTKANLAVLRGKYVLLLISKIELPAMELSMLNQIYKESIQNQGGKESKFEVVWLPIVDNFTQRMDKKQKQNYEEIMALMPWYTVSHPSLIDPAAIKFIKEVWHFDKKPVLVVLDAQGKVVNPNAIHMMFIWGSFAYPFTSSREEALWKEESWGLELLIDSIEPLVFNWVAKGKYICIYGGEEPAWIKKFTLKAKGVAEAAKIELEMLYVGKSNPGERIRTNIATILTENLSHALPNPVLIQFFWIRLESMWYSKTQCGENEEDDPIMREIATLLSFDRSGDGWALLSKGTADIVQSNAETISKCLNEFDQWKETAKREGFMPVLKKQLLITPHSTSL